MRGKLEKRDKILDIQHPLIRQVAEMIFEATGERLLVVHPETFGWGQVYVEAQTPLSLPFCKLIQGTTEGAKHCHMCHILMAVAACSGGPMEQRCHAGATVLVYPVPTPSYETCAVLSSCMFTA